MARQRQPYIRWLAPIAETFFAERCQVGRQHEDTFARLYAGFIEWLEGKPHATPSRQGFGRLLRARGYVKRCSNRDSFIRGLRLREQPTARPRR